MEGSALSVSNSDESDTRVNVIILGCTWLWIDLLCAGAVERIRGHGHVKHSWPCLRDTFEWCRLLTPLSKRLDVDFSHA